MGGETGNNDPPTDESGTAKRRHSIKREADEKDARQSYGEEAQPVEAHADFNEKEQPEDGQERDAIPRKAGVPPFAPTSPESHEVDHWECEIHGENGCERRQCPELQRPGQSEQGALHEIDHVLGDVGDLEKPQLLQTHCRDEVRVEDEKSEQKAENKHSFAIEQIRPGGTPSLPSPKKEDRKGEERGGSVSLVEEGGEADKSTR